MSCIETAIVIYNVRISLVVYETENRQKYLPGRKFFEITLNDKIRIALTYM